MRLVAHLEHLGEDAGDVGRLRGAADRGLQQRAEHVAHPAQPGQHLGAVRAVAQHLAQALVERAVRPLSTRAVLQHPHPHGRRDDSGHRADGAAVVARLEADAAARLEERDGVLGVVDESLQRGTAHERAAQRAGRPLPVDRRPGVQELTRLEAEHLGRRGDVDEVGGDAEHRLDGARVGLDPAGVGGDARQVRLGARHRRSPVDALDVDGLTGDGVGEHVGADSDDQGVGGAGGDDCGLGHWDAPLLDWLSRSRARRVAEALEKCTSAPPARASRAGGQALRVEVGADEADDHRDRAVPAGLGDGRREQRRRVGLGAVAEHEVEQDHAGRRVGGRPGQLVVAQRRVDHRVGAALGEGVVAEVDHHVVVGGQVVQLVGGEREVGGQRDVAADRAEHLGRDQHRLVAQRAADEEPAQQGTGRRPAVARHRPRECVVAEPGEHRLGDGGQVALGRDRGDRARPGWTACRRTTPGRARPRRRVAWRPRRPDRPRGRRRAGAAPRASRSHRPPTTGRDHPRRGRGVPRPRRTPHRRGGAGSAAAGSRCRTRRRCRSARAGRRWRSRDPRRRSRRCRSRVPSRGRCGRRRRS